MTAQAQRTQAVETHRDAGRVRVLTWHVHGSYLYYLSHAPVDFYLPVKDGRPEGYGGRSGHFAWPGNVHEAPAEAVREMDFDLVLYQSRRNWLHDRYEVLDERQRRLPRIYLEHDPPRESPTETRHPVDDPDTLLVHVTPFNDLMWDSGGTPTRVIDHGVAVPPGLAYTGEFERGIVVVNGLAERGRRLGADVFARARERVALDLAGMGSEALGGVGDVPRDRLLALETRYRFYFHPIRYTSLGLSVLEAMMLGLPVVGLATTELPTVVEDGVSGFTGTDPDRLIACMQRLLRDPDEAYRLGEGARRRALERFHIDRFVQDWTDTIEDTASRGISPPAAARARATEEMGE